MSTYGHVLSWVQGEVWALERGFAERAWTMLQSRIAHGPAPRRAAVGTDRTRSASGARSSVAVLSLGGVLSQRLSVMDEMCGGATSLDQFQRAFNTAIADPNIKAVVVNADTPGGSVYGTQETFNTIFRARGTKPIIGQVNSLAASAGYWILSACDEIAMTPSGEAGSIGVFCLHLDSSRAVDAAGIKPTFITSGGSPYKVEGNSLEPLSAEAAAAVQDSVDRYFRAFVGNVAKGRGTTPSNVTANYGRGRTLGASQALSAGMVDKIQPLSATLAGLVRGRSATGASASTADAYRRGRHRRRLVTA